MRLINEIRLMIFFALVISVPIALTTINIIALFRKRLNRILRIISWSLTLFAGLIYSILFTAMTDIQPYALWSDQLYNSQLHQPFWFGALGIYITFILLAIAGFIILAAVPLRKTPPLLMVLSMAVQYPLIGTCIVWCIQISRSVNLMPLVVLPVNIIIIIITLFRKKIDEWHVLQIEKDGSGAEGTGKNAFITACNKCLNNSHLWPLWAFAAAIPVLAIILGISLLCGQQPDALIKAWTETADWRLSGQTAPPNLYYDEHYLCTVAAGGHEKLVKPLRYGQRHGHRVVVNRQLEIANAFEQILEEKTPRLHRAVRGFYDRCGFPIARLIRTKTACDVVYFIMKPLEWIFLCVIYLTDPRPEDRIAVQYMPGYRSFQKKLKDQEN